MSTDDRTETITDRAAIRDSDEPSERGDFPCCAPASGATVAALDLDAMHETICDKFTGMDEVQQAADALVAEVRSLRAKVAAVEALHAKEPDVVIDYIHRGLTPVYGDGCSECGGAWPCDTRAALETGEGK